MKRTTYGGQSSFDCRVYCGCNRRMQGINEKLFDRSFLKMLTVSSANCLLIPKILILVVQLGFEKRPLKCLRSEKLNFTSIAMTNTSEETSFCFNFHKFQNLGLSSLGKL